MHRLVPTQKTTALLLFVMVFAMTLLPAFPPIHAAFAREGGDFPANQVLESDLSLQVNRIRGKAMPGLISDLLGRMTHEQAVSSLKSQIEGHPRLQTRHKVYLAQMMQEIILVSEKMDVAWVAGFFLDFYNAVPDADKCEALPLLLNTAELYARVNRLSDSYETYEFLQSEIHRCHCGLLLPLHYVSYARSLLVPKNELEEVLTYNLKALQLADSLRFSRKDDPMVLVVYADVLESIAITHYMAGNHNSAISYWEKVVRLFPQEGIESRDLIASVNNIGMSWSKLKEYDSANTAFEKAIALAEVYEDSVWLGIAKGNLGNLLFKRGNCEEALPHAQESIVLSLNNFELSNAFDGILSEAEIKICMADIQGAQESLEKARALVAKHPDHFSINRGFSELPILRIQYKLSLARNDFKAAIGFQTDIRQLEDAANLSDLGDKLMSLQARHELEKEVISRQLLSVELKRSRLQTVVILLTSAFLLILAAWAVVAYRQKLHLAKVESLRMQAEKLAETQKTLRLREQMETETKLNRLRQAQMEEELSIKERELSTTAMHIIQKGELLASVQHKLDELTKRNRELAPEFKAVYDAVRQDSQLDADWGKFKTHFEQVHSGFFTKLSKNHPDLSLQEIRMCAYLRMNLDNKSIAQMLNVQPDSLRVTRYRLRKKLGQETDKSLYQMLCVL